MNVLSLFDGISCAKIALEQLNIKINNYYSSEIDRFAISVSQKNYPDIIQLGDIRKINPRTLPKIDLLIGGSPCQDLSAAQKGLGLKGEKSRLFYEYIRIYESIKPKYFLLENVKNKWGELMNTIIGTKFIEVNSALFSAQSRPRYYWTNIRHKPFPKKISNEVIKNIIENEVSDVFFFNKPGLTTYIKKNTHKIINKKTPTKDGIIKILDLPKHIINDNERQRRVYSIESKSPTILARSDTTKIIHNNKLRKLTPLECERLQKIPDNYTDICSNTQRYKMIGNAFTVDVIKYFLNSINEN